ncbi:right-handed parallel beta-helix repeat-containing protein [bacterium]|nr:right-handed parallel beta-helix repeat-containing protein [bacterium]
MSKIFGYISLFCISLSCTLCSENQGYSQWLKRRESLIKDATVMRYYTFEDVKDSESVVTDLGKEGKTLKFVPYKDPATKEEFNDLKVIEGRWPEKKAVSLDRGFYQGEAYNIQDKQFSVEVWFRRQGPGSIVAAMKRQDGTILGVSGYTRGWRIITAYERDLSIRFSIGQPVGSANLFTKTPLPDNTWHHLVVTWDGNQMKMYVNGKFVEQVMTEMVDRKAQQVNKFSGEYVKTDYPFKIGFSEHGVGSLKLDIDEVVIYNRVLSEEEVSVLGRGPSGVSQDDVFMRADTYIKAGDYKKARVEYEKLKGLASYGKELSFFNIAESYRKEKDYANVHKTYNEIFSIPNLSTYYRIYGLFQQAEVYIEQKNYIKARELYNQIIKTDDALEHHLFTSYKKIGDTFRDEKKYSEARKIYERLLVEQESLPLPHEGYRLDLRNRLEEIEDLKDGSQIKSRDKKIEELIESPKRFIYVSPKGADTNSGTKARPFATITRAQEEVRKIKASGGIPAGGISVYLREGRYFIDKSISFGKEDSGTENSPIVYRSYPNEKVRIIGGKQVKGFKLLTDPAIIKRLPEESKGKVWTADLKSQGITDYGELLNRGGHGGDVPGAMELFFNGAPMRLARWPNEGHARVAGLFRVDGVGRGEFQKAGFVYSGDRPERWLEEKDVWLHGFWHYVYSKDHVKLKSIDTKNKVINTYYDTRWGETYPLYSVPISKDTPYYVYNLLSEIDTPGEWYVDRETGKLYIYPPDKIENSEVIASMLSTSLISMDETSYIIFFGVTFEATRTHGIEIKRGRNNYIVASTIKNVGEWAVNINGGFEHSIVGCDIFDTGEGGVSLDFLGGRSKTTPFRKKLIPARHLVINNHIHRFNRFDGGYRQGVRIDGVGQIVSHNVIHDSPMQGIYFNANDHIVEFNEMHDVVYEGRELGSIYIYGEPWYLMSRGTVIRNNYFHHISTHSSPNTNQGLNAIHIDAINGGLVIEKNFFYRIPNGVSNAQPENRIENNVFIDSEARAISQGDRSALFYNQDETPKYRTISHLASQRLAYVRYKQPPWSYRYPQLFDMLYRERPIGLSQNNFIERNINTGGPFITFSRGAKEHNIVKNNWDGDEPLFLDREGRDLAIRPGSPVYGLTGAEPITMDGIGVYKSSLRASWPISRSQEDIGKYYYTDWKPMDELSKTILVPLKRVKSPSTYTIPVRKNPVTIDGKLDVKEWGNLDIKKAMVIEQQFQGEQVEGAKSYVWLLHDNENLYIAIKNDPDPFKEGMLTRMKKHSPLFEVAIESQHSSQTSSWWSDDMVTGPIYTMSFFYDGEYRVNNLFKMNYKDVAEIEKNIEYKRVVLDDENKVWTAEVKIPFKSLGIDLKEVEQLAFNMGAYKKTDWFAWVATGTSIWRVENAGFIKFAK